MFFSNQQTNHVFDKPTKKDTPRHPDVIQAIFPGPRIQHRLLRHRLHPRRQAERQLLRGLPRYGDEPQDDEPVLLTPMLRMRGPEGFACLGVL